MSEPHPHHLETGLGIDEASAAELQRLFSRIKQEQVQLTADRRQLRQERIELDRLTAEREARQQELQQQLTQVAQTDRQLQTQQQRLLSQETEVLTRQQSLDTQAAQLHLRERAAATLEQQLTSSTNQLDAKEKDLTGRQSALEAQHRQVVQQQATLEVQAADLKSRSDRLSTQMAERQAADQGLTELRQHLAQREASLQDLSITLDAHQAEHGREIERLHADREDLDRQKEQLQADRASVTKQQEDLRRRQMEQSAQQKELARLQEAAVRLKADVGARDSRIVELEASIAAQAGRMVQADQRRQQAAALEAACQQKQQDLKALAESLAEQKRCLDLQVAERARQEKSASQEVRSPKPQSVLPSPSAAVVEQLTMLNRRFEGVQAEAAVLRQQKQKIAAERDSLEEYCSSLQAQCTLLQKKVDEAKVAPPGKSHETTADVPRGPADALAVLAAHAAKARRTSRGQRSGDGPAKARKALLPVLVATGAAVAGAGIMLAVQPGQYKVRAQMVLPAGSALAERSQMTRAQWALGGRLLEASKVGGAVAGASPLVSVDVDGRSLSVQVVSRSPRRDVEGLSGLLRRYSKEMQGEMLTAAQRQQGEQLAGLIAGNQARLKALTEQKADLMARIAAVEPHEKAYSEAARVATKARQDLDELRARSEKAAAGLRVLLRTAPSSRGQFGADQLDREVSRDSQLMAVRGQVAARATALQEMLLQLLKNGADTCEKMDGQLGSFVAFLEGQIQQISDEMLKAEVRKIIAPSQTLRRIVQDSRGQIETLAADVGGAKDVDQAKDLVTLHAQSEKALESLTAQAQETIRQIDALQEKIPAGGVDVTRRTVLQQRLRAPFALLEKTYQEMAETLNDLRPSVNFRLDAALSGVEGLARQYDQRYKALTEQVQQQESKLLRQKYDKQVQETRAELDDYNLQRDRVLVTLTAAGDRMAKADGGRAEGLTLRGQMADLNQRAGAAGEALEEARKQTMSLAATTSQPAGIAWEGPIVEAGAVNSRNRIVSAILAAATLFGVALGIGLRRGDRVR